MKKIKPLLNVFSIKFKAGYLYKEVINAIKKNNYDDARVLFDKLNEKEVKKLISFVKRRYPNHPFLRKSVFLDKDKQLVKLIVKLFLERSLNFSRKQHYNSRANFLIQRSPYSSGFISEFLLALYEGGNLNFLAKPLGDSPLLVYLMFKRVTTIKFFYISSGALGDFAFVLDNLSSVLDIYSLDSEGYNPFLYGKKPFVNYLMKVGYDPFYGSPTNEKITRFLNQVSSNSFKRELTHYLSLWLRIRNIPPEEILDIINENNFIKEVSIRGIIKEYAEDCNQNLLEFLKKI